MDSLIEYKIPFRGISEGEHEYDFHIQEKFFDAMESDEVQDADVKVHLQLDKQSRLMVLDFAIHGNLVLTCDRCLEDMNYPLDIDYRLIAKYGRKDPRDEENEDVFYLADDEFQLDVSRLIYENIVLAIPIKHVHADDEQGHSTCNPEQLKILENYSKKQKTDPRWDALKNIKFED